MYVLCNQEQELFIEVCCSLFNLLHRYIFYAYTENINISDLLNELKLIFSKFSDICSKFAKTNDLDKQYDYALEVLQAISSCILRNEIPFNAKKYLRPMNKHKRAEIYINMKKQLWLWLWLWLPVT